MDPKKYPILYVDDEHANRVVMKHNLGRQFTLLMAESAHEALEILAQQPVAVLLTDQRMPGMSGVELAAQVLQQYPDVVRVILTAYSDLEATIDAINQAQVNRFIKKPWSREELVAVVRESLASYHTTRLVKELQERLTGLDRIAAVAVMASAIAHDLRQPLAYIEPSLTMLRDEVGRLLLQPQAAPVYDRLGQMQDALGDVSHGVDKFKLITSTLLTSLKTHEVKLRPMEIREVIQSAVTLTRGTVTRRALLELDLPETDVWVAASEGRLIQLVVNLLLNAVQAISSGASMSNRVCVGLRSQGEHAEIWVSDTGCGIAPETLEGIFTPFFTTKGASGSGLGLAICRQIVEEMDGSIEVDTVVGRGTTFTVKLPLAQG